MSAPLSPSKQTVPEPEQSDTATIVEMNPRQMVTWTMPREVYDIVERMLESWPFVTPRQPRATVERVLTVVEMRWPDVRSHITREVKETPKPAARGHKADVYITEQWVHSIWAENQPPTEWHNEYMAEFWDEKPATEEPLP